MAATRATVVMVATAPVTAVDATVATAVMVVVMAAAMVVVMAVATDVVMAAAMVVVLAIARLATHLAMVAMVVDTTPLPLVAMSRRPRRLVILLLEPPLRERPAMMPLR